MVLGTIFEIMRGNRKETTQTACDDCGVVQEVDLVTDEEIAGVPVEAHTHDECAVCGSAISVDSMRFAGR